jgi:hypothetical protein
MKHETLAFVEVSGPSTSRPGTTVESRLELISVPKSKDHPEQVRTCYFRDGVKCRTHLECDKGMVSLLLLRGFQHPRIGPALMASWPK